MQEFEETGTIIDTSSDSSIVSVAIGNSLKLFSFTKAMFFTFGMRCDGDMDNILETGMEVNLSYKLRSNGIPYVVAVWLGDKPTSPEDRLVLKSLYNQIGTVVRSGSDNLLVECDNSREVVLIEKRVVYHDGCLLHGSALPPVDRITFDAIPLNHKMGLCGDFPQAMYEATCAWTGMEEPRLVDRFGLQNKEENKSEDDVDVPDVEVNGTVAVVPNDIVAFVDVDSDCVVGKVILFRWSLSTDHTDHSPEGRLQDMISAGDTLCLRIRRGYLFLGRSQWFAITAWKCCVEIGTDVKTEDNGMKLSEGFDVVTKNKETVALAASSSSADSRKDTTVNKTLKFDESSKVLYNNPPLTGLIYRTSFDTACISFGNLKILVEKSDFFFEKKQCTANQFDQLVSSGENTVKFEAILLNHDQKTKEKNSELKITHKATCAWIGKKPPLHAIAPTLSPPKLSVSRGQNRRFRGVVVKYALPMAALAYLEEENTTVYFHIIQCGWKPKALSGCSLKKDCIINFVKLNDLIDFKIRVLSGYPDMLCAFDIKVLKNDVRERRKDFESKNCGKIPVSLNNCTGVSKVLNPISNPTASKVNIVSSFDKPATTGIYRVPLRKIQSSKDKPRLLNCHGMLKEVQNGAQCGFTLEHDLGFSSVINTPVIYEAEDNVHITSNTFGVYAHRQIRFDAEVAEFSKKTAHFSVQRMWFPESSRPPEEFCLSPKLFAHKDCVGAERLVPTSRYSAIIHTLPFHDCAIAHVRGIPVLVPLKSLVTCEEVNTSYSSIDLYLCVGKEVYIKVEEKTLKGSDDKYYEATECWACESSTKTAGQERTGEVRKVAWADVWGARYFCIQGRAVQKGDNYCVDFVTSQKTSSRQTLNLFSNGKVFVDGVLTNADKARIVNNRDISFHVAVADHQEENRRSSSSCPFYIPCAWIGEEPSPEQVLIDRLSVPKGLLSTNWWFEVVVEEFPLPSHAICRIGSLPVLVPLTKCHKDGKPIVSDIHLRKGDRLFAPVQEVNLGKHTFLKSNQVPQKMSVYQHVLRKWNGTVTKLPGPVGIITIIPGNIKVCFELCHVQTEKNYYNDNKKLAVLFEDIQSKIRIGTCVFVTAVKVGGKTAPYRALEVTLKNVA